MSLSNCPSCWDTPCHCGYVAEQGKKDLKEHAARMKSRVVCSSEKTDGLENIEPYTFCRRFLLQLAEEKENK